MSSRTKEKEEVEEEIKRESLRLGCRSNDVDGDVEKGLKNEKMPSNIITNNKDSQASMKGATSRSTMHSATSKALVKSVNAVIESGSMFAILGGSGTLYACTH
jgi:hypothetical protein